MDKKKVMELLKTKLGLKEADEIEYKPEFLVVRFFYDYDEDELGAASDYANSQPNSDDENIWYDEHYIPYIIDIAVDEVRDTLQEIVEEASVNVEFISYEPERDDEYCEFIAVFTDEDKEVDIDEVMDALSI